METSHKMFLLAVEEMNFTKAARRAFVTQQCLSEHIKRLEADLGTRLFVRSPRLSLTPSGEALYKVLQKSMLLEKALRLRIAEIEKGQVGQIRFGLNATRARLLIPELLAEFHQQFPLVTIEVIMDDTVRLIDSLRTHKLDAAFGINTPYTPDLDMEPAGEEDLLLVARNSLLKAHYSGSQPFAPYRTGESIDLCSFDALPQVTNRKGSTVEALSRHYLESLNRPMQPIFKISDYTTQLEVCQRGLAATFCSSFMYEAVEQNNRLHPDLEPLVGLPLMGAKERIHTEILTPKMIYRPAYLTAFIKILTRCIREKHRAADAVFAAGKKHKEKELL